ncbi:bactofilin family protein [Natronogracilivirga saccharolytica]|uniref:Polymer-forming cytoskeletal protein n=1 Tax=Natronogracilivirga saccharolytica TaxID=2812953 RepID=A0A8J7S7L6_9BACT|nr:polymer-forming cytoskeletal protein [Natronogracilivirga saccharolytica]MBP3191693.1 polymer-forming cytoskeletal protein [Natronogracilivirga saccharolytica]
MAQNNIDYVSFIGTNSVFSEGKIRVVSDLKISGLVEMDIESKGKVIVTESGKVKGSIEAADINIHGEADGDISATGMIMISSSGKVNGSLAARYVSIDDGGICNGRMVTGEDAPNRIREKTAAADQALPPENITQNELKELSNEQKDGLDIDWKSLREKTRR